MGSISQCSKRYVVLFILTSDAAVTWTNSHPTSPPFYCASTALLRVTTFPMLPRECGAMRTGAGRGQSASRGHFPIKGDAAPAVLLLSPTKLGLVVCRGWAAAAACQSLPAAALAAHFPPSPPKARSCYLRTIPCLGDLGLCPAAPACVEGREEGPAGGRNPYPVSGWIQLGWLAG